MFEKSQIKRNAHTGDVVSSLTRQELLTRCVNTPTPPNASQIVTLLQPVSELVIRQGTATPQSLHPTPLFCWC
jgi:hypothetical protein